MKIILSRKGVDSRSGEMASPILPCGCLCSIPIPGSPPADRRYSEMWFGARTLLEICTELRPGWSHTFGHLDPDLRREALASRPLHWRPGFGQVRAAAGHLDKQGVGKKSGDLFIFFGWFRRTRQVNRRLEFDPKDVAGRHIAYGWLEVGKIVNRLPLDPNLAFLKGHPHVAFFRQPEMTANRIYVSSEKGLGAGVFGAESDCIVLSQEGLRQRSHWLLDEAFESLLQDRDLSYHEKEGCWYTVGTKIGLKTVSRGQEFVFDGEKHSKAHQYLVDRINRKKNKAVSCSHAF